VESDDPNGLVRTLAGLLTRYPPEGYLETKDYSAMDSVDREIDGIYCERFVEAINSLSTESPRILLRLKDHQEELGVALFDLLRALLKFYYDNRMVHPN